MNGERRRWLRMKLRRLFRRGKEEAALDAEMQFHHDQLVAQFRAEGMAEHEALLAARRELGDVGSYREEIRDSWRPPELADLWRTLRFAVRSLARTPGFTIFAVVTLAFGIGANTVMFSAFNTIVLKPLPYPDVARLGRIDRSTPHDPEGLVSPADFLDLRRQMDSYGELAALAFADASLSERGQPTEIARAARTTANFFATLGVSPQLGRDFRPGEDTPGKDHVVIISRRCWQNRFGGSPDVIGRTIRIDGEPHDIVGVLPDSFNDWRHLGNIDLFRPLALDAQAAADRHGTSLVVILRRAATVSPAEVDGFVTSFGARLAAEYPEIHAAASWHPIGLGESVMKDSRVMLGMCIGLSAFVLLIACSNLANLLLARTIARAREFALRAALGASRGQLLRPLIAESLLLSLAGAAGALLVATWIGDWLAVRSTGDNGEQVVLFFDWRVFGWALLAALVTAVVFGLAPALFALRLNVNDTLKSGGRGMTGDRGHRRFRQLLIVGQFAGAMILLAGAAQFIRGLDELNNRRAGWESEHLVTATVALPPIAYPDAERITAFHRRIVEQLQRLPGVASASISSFTPFFNWPDVRRFLVEGSQPPERGHEPAAVVNRVSPRYFETVGTRVLAGRAFDERDGAAAPRVFIINQAMANGLFGNESALGRHLARVDGEGQQAGEIVGVVADVISVLPDPRPVTFQLYQPMAQEAVPFDQILVRTAGVAPATVVAGIRGVMTDLDPDLPVRNLKTADASIERANYQPRVLRDILSGFAVLGLFLASLGIYGVIARTMSQRTSEFAIRFALGARIFHVTRIVLASGLKLALIGSAFGLIGALGLCRILAYGFPSMQLSDPLVLVGTTLVLVTVALVACWLPARRAARINPVEALRAE